MCKDREILTNCYKLDKSDGSHIWDPFNYVSRPFDIDKYVMKTIGMFTDSVSSQNGIASSKEAIGCRMNSSSAHS